VFEAVFEDGLGNDAGASGITEERHHLRLHIRRETGVRHCFYIDRLKLLRSPYSHPVVSNLQTHSGLAQFSEKGLQVLWNYVGDHNFSAGDGRGHNMGARLNPVWNNRVLCRPEIFLLDPFNLNGVHTGPFDPAADAVDEILQVDDFRFLGRIPDDGHPAGQDGGHHDILGRAYAGHIQVNLRAGEPLGRSCNIAVLFRNDGAHGRKPFQMQVHRAASDLAAARIGKFGPAEAAEEGAQDKVGRPHAPHQRLGNLNGPDSRGVHFKGTVFTPDLRAQIG